MNKDRFWEIIEKVRNQCKDDAEKMVDALQEELEKHPVIKVKVKCRKKEAHSHGNSL